MAGKRIRHSPRLFEREVKQARLSVLHDGKTCEGTEEDVRLMEARLQEWLNLVEYRKDVAEPTPLISAVISQHELCVQFLLAQGADVHATIERTMVTNACVTSCSMNVLVIATVIATSHVLHNKDEEVIKRIVRLLLEHGSDTKSIINIDGQNASLFEYLIRNNCIDYVEIFLQSGADPNFEIMEDDFSCITCAMLKGHHEILEILLKYGAKVDDYENNILHIPISEGLTKCLKSLFIYNTIEEMRIHTSGCNTIHIPSVFIIFCSECTLEINIKSLRMYHKFGGNLWELDEQELVEIIDSDDSISLHAEMEKLRSNPLSLKELSRVVILKTMGRRFPQHSDSLELPATLRTFLKFPDVET